MAMSRLYMSCALCGRKQAHGLLSHAYWAQVEVAGASVHRVCPTCKEQHRDWEDRARAAVIELGAQEASPPGNGAAYR
jgi:hypothetical protein